MAKITATFAAASLRKRDSKDVALAIITSPELWMHQQGDTGSLLQNSSAMGLESDPEFNDSKTLKATHQTKSSRSRTERA